MRAYPAGKTVCVLPELTEERLMRVLVTCIPQAGHITPILPLAEAFAAQGDEVVVASGPEAAEPVSRRGLAFRQVGPALGDWFGALAGRTRGTPARSTRCATPCA